MSGPVMLAQFMVSGTSDMTRRRAPSGLQNRSYELSGGGRAISVVSLARRVVIACLGTKIPAVALPSDTSLVPRPSDG